VANANDIIVGRLVIERAYVTHAQLDDALDAQRAAHDAAGLDLSLLQVLENKRLLSPDQAQDLRHAAAVETGEAFRVGGYEVVAKIGQGASGPSSRREGSTRASSSP